LQAGFSPHVRAVISRGGELGQTMVLGNRNKGMEGFGVFYFSWEGGFLVKERSGVVVFGD